MMVVVALSFIGEGGWAGGLCLQLSNLFVAASEAKKMRSKNVRIWQSGKAGKAGNL